MVFVSLPSRKRTHNRWAAALLALVALTVFLWLRWGLDATARGEVLQHWGTVSGSSGQWRSLWLDGRVVRLFSALFIHASFLHLLGNGLFLLIFGAPSERALGPWRLLALFLVGGAAGNLVAALLIGEPARVIIGASGGISALVGAYLVLFPKARLGVVVPLGLWLEFIKLPAAALIGLWVLLQLAFTYAGPAFGAMAWSAHLTGFVVGAVMAVLFRPSLRRQSRG
jgi:membrane associated rhomboid family serine protease